MLSFHMEIFTIVAEKVVWFTMYYSLRTYYSKYAVYGRRNV